MIVLRKIVLMITQNMPHDIRRRVIGDTSRQGWNYMARDVLIVKYCFHMMQLKENIVVCHQQYNQCIFVKEGSNLVASMVCALDVISCIQRVVIDGVGEKNT